ncbi:MAG: hypothetical protein WC494_04210 [Candidatus Pacearchaeota archaeon]
MGLPWLYYERAEVNSPEVLQIKRLLCRSGIPIVDMHPATEVGHIPYIHLGQYRFCGVQGVKDFIRMVVGDLEFLSRDSIS